MSSADYDLLLKPTPLASPWQTSLTFHDGDQYVFTRTYGHISDWNVSGFTNMQNAFKDRTTFYSIKMFSNASLFNQPIGDWNVSSVSRFAGMFNRADAFNQEIRDWNTSSATHMDYMFYSSFNKPIGNWDVSSVINFKGIFAGDTVFNQPIGNWDMSSTTNLTHMFMNNHSFNQQIGDWNVTSVTNMGWHFLDCNRLSFRSF